jgi:NTE family protein
VKAIVVFILLAVLIANAFTPENPSPVRIGLALSGGAALGLAHIGVIKVLEEAGIPISAISGNSMGSMVGGVYAAGYTAAEIESIAVNANWSMLFSSNPSFGAQYLPERQQDQRYIIQLRHRNFFPALPSGLVPLQNVEFLLMKLLSHIEYNTGYDFNNLPIPYRTIAVDLVTGDKVVLKKGRLENAIRASIAIPGVFAPEELDNQELVDGGVQQYLPVDPLKEFKPDFIIAALTMKHNQETGVSLIDIVSRSMDVVSVKDLDQQKKLADVLIEPNVDPFMHSDFSRARELIAAGESAARAKLPEIYAQLAGRNLSLAHYRNKVATRALPYIHAIRFEGLRITHSRLLYNEIKTRPGNYLNFDQLLSDLRRLFNTGLFEDVNYRLEFTGFDWVDVIIVVKEKAYGFYSLGLRYDNVDKVGLGLEVGQGNLWGSGAGIRGAVNWGNPTEYLLGFTGTRLFRLPFGYRLDGFWTSVDRSYYDKGNWLGDYTYDQRGGIIEAGYILGYDGFFKIGFQAFQNLYRMPAVPLFAAIPKREWVVGPTFLMEFNNYNDLFFPSRGGTYHLAAFLANHRLKSSNDFLKIDFSADRLVPLKNYFLFRYGLEFGISWGKLAWSEYFHCGGENLAGFAKDEFTSPQKAIVRLGADFRLFHLFNRNDYPFYLQLLSNIATFEKANRLVNNPKLDSVLDWGVGIGFRTNTPIGPLQFILGVADFAKPSADSLTRINVWVSIGKDFRYTKD